MLPNSRAHPVIEQPVTFRAWAALPAAGAWDPAPVEAALAGYRTVLFYLTYQRGDAGGGFDFKIEVSPYSADKPARNWFQTSLYTAGTLIPGSDVESDIQREYLSYLSTGATAEGFLFGPVDLGIAAERLRVTCRESGVPATPGSVEIIGLMGMEA